MRKPYQIVVCILVTLFLVIGCRKTTNTPTISFYYWKTTFKLSPLEEQGLVNNKVKNLYIRYFDIDIDPVTHEPIPLSPIIFAHKVDSFRVIPVLYIKNRVLLQENIDLTDLAQKCYNLTEQINTKQCITCNEIQIDCDWTLKTRDNYLKFIELFKNISKKELSATIRLHQIKYFKTTKIPNVARGVLMYYNMGHIGADSLNSIYNRKIASKYLASLANYPLQLNVALPIYSWAVHSSNKKVINLISKVNIADFENDTNFIAQSVNLFKAINATIKQGYYFKQGDEIKIESISSTDLIEMANDLSNNLKTAPQEVIYYDLDDTNLKNYTNENHLLQEITHHF